MQIKFTVLGTPIPKGRPRLGRKSSVYTPKRTRVAEDSFKLQASKHEPDELIPIDVPVSLTLTFYFPFPKKQIHTDKHIEKIDLDNLIKLCLDSMNGRFFADDRQVFQIIATKLYTLTKPKTEITLTTL